MSELNSVNCKRCLDERWVCENHSRKSWEHPDGCSCGAGMPCPDCNTGPGFPVPQPGCIKLFDITGMN